MWIFAELSGQDMQNWSRQGWTPLLGYVSKINILMNAWFWIHFLQLEDTENIFRIPWVRGKQFLQLHKWYIGFNPSLDTPKNEIIWVKLPDLPLAFWTKRELT